MSHEKGLIIRGGGGLGTDHDHDTLEFTPFLMVKKVVDHDHDNRQPGKLEFAISMFKHGQF